MKRKGFTLIEMIAVIAILGILVLTVLPNILKIYRNSKKMAFIDEAKVVYSKVTDDFVLNKTKGKRVNYVSNEEENHYTLDLQNEKDLKYTITLNNKGVVTGFLLKNTEFCIVGVGDFLNDYTIEQVIDLRDNGNGVDEEETQKCEIEVFQDGTELYLDLVNKISDSDEGASLAKPDLLTLKYGSGWYDRETKESLGEGDGYSIRTIPHKYNHYYEKSTTDNIDVVSCNGTILIDDQGNTKNLQKFYAKGEMRKKAVSEFSKKFYTVNFKLNEKETGSINPITCYYGESCKLPNNLDNNGYGLSIKKIGYLFKGWKYSGVTFENNGTLPTLNDDNEDKTIDGIDLSKFKFDNVEVCKNGESTNNRNKKPFEAIWEPIKYTIAYNCNGGTSSTASSNHTYDIEKELTSNGCKRVGYTFKGWSETSTGSVKYTDKQKVLNLTSENGKTVTLYAVWQLNYSYIYYSGLNKHGNDVTINSYVDIPNDHHNADGTLHQYHGTTINYQLNDYDITMNDDTTKYFNVIFLKTVNSEGKFIVMRSNVPNSSVFSSHDNGLPGPQNPRTGINLTYVGHTIPTGKEWKCASGNCNKTTYDQAKKDYRSSDFCNSDVKDCYVVLEPNWEYGTYTITLNNQSATTAGTTTIYEKYNTGYYLDSGLTKKMTTSVNPISKPTKTGHTFAGYYTAANGGGTQYIDGNGKLTSSASTKNFANAGTLYAKWSINPYTISIQPNGGKYNNTTSNTTLNVEFLKAVNIPNPTREGYTFTGWTITNHTELTAMMGTSASNINTLITGTPKNTYYKNLRATNGTVTFKANWSANNYTVTFNVNGGTAWTSSRCGSGNTYNSSNNSCKKTVTYNSTYGSLPTPVRSGNWYFTGWYTKASGGTKITSSTTYTTVGNQTLYAQWTNVCTAARYVASGKTIVRWINGNANTAFSEFAIGCEHFYVLYTSGNNIVALSKYNLNYCKWTNDSSIPDQGYYGRLCYNNRNDSEYGYQLTSNLEGGYTKYDSTGSSSPNYNSVNAVSECNNYANKLKSAYGINNITSGLMTATILKKFCSGVEYGASNMSGANCNAKLFTTYYWGATPTSRTEFPSYKDWNSGGGIRIAVDGEGTKSVDYPQANPATNRPGVRPIITINKNQFN